MPRRTGRLLAATLLAAASARAVELDIHFGALERMLAKEMFTEEGRKYVRGSRTARCSFAYLEQPRVEGDGGRLRVRARFTGRSALNMFGQCVGLGDAFSLTILATPVWRDGTIRLSGVTVASDRKTGFYIHRVCTAMAASLERDFRYPIAAEARKALEDTGAQSGYKRELSNFHVGTIRVTGDALALEIDFALALK